MKKRVGIVLLLVVVLGMAWLPAMGEEDYVKVNFSVFCGAGETIQPDYPDFSYLIGEGLTKDDFTITYECPTFPYEVDCTTGQLSVSETVNYCKSDKLLVTYTPKVEGVGERTVFQLSFYRGVALKYIKTDHSELILGSDQKSTLTVRYNSSQIPRSLRCEVLDTEIVSATMESSGEWTAYAYLKIVPKAVGETTITVYGYNGISVDVHVKVMEPPTELTFPQEVYECFEGEALSLGIKLGDGEHAPNFSFAQVNGNAAGEYFKDGITGVFCSDVWGEFRLRVETYNGFSGSTVIRVYEKDVVSDIKLSADIVRAGEENIKVRTFDAAGEYVRARYISITKGMDIASLDDNNLITTGPGEIEVTVTNLDGTTVSRTFTIEPYPNELVLNASEITMDIGDTFDVEVGFDQGSLPYKIYVGNAEGHSYSLPAIRIEGNRLIAQNSGTARVIVQAGSLVGMIDITVPVSDKTPVLVWPEEDPFPVNGTFRFAVKDMAGNILPATFSLWVNDQSGTITEDGYFKAVKAGSVSITATLEDGRKLGKSLEIVQKPNWMRVGSMIITVGESKSITVATDVGELYTWDLEVSVKDESIVKWNYPTLRAQKVGKTEVTVTCVHNGASTTFTVEVRPKNDNVFVGATSFELPYGFSAELPVVYDEKGKEKKVKWVITHNNPGEGNPEKSGFILEDNVITCTWPTASCEVTGYMDGESKWVRVTVFGYKMAETIRIEPEIISIPVGGEQRVEVVTDEPGAVVTEVYWLADKEGIVNWSEYGNQAYWKFVGNNPGTTLVMAFLDNGAYALCMVTVYDPNAQPDTPDDPADRVPGDADQDGKVTILDALAVLQYSVGWSVDISLSNADVDGDGAVTILDALTILQYCVGWDIELL